MKTKNDALRAEIAGQMLRNYLLFCIPRTTINMRTQEITHEYFWTDKDAEESYKNLSELLAMLNAQEKQAAMDRTKSLVRELLTSADRRRGESGE